MKKRKNATKIGVVLAGCGQWDGTDVHEAVLTLLALDRAGAGIVCIAPEINHLHVLNHATHEEMPETRSVAVEASRLGIGAMIDLRTASAGDLNGVIVPGGQGTIKHLSNFALKGPSSMVQKDLDSLLKDMHDLKRPIGAMSAAVMVVVSALRGAGPSVTVGTDANTAAAVETMGGSHQACRSDMIHTDDINHIVTTPGYMAGASISRVALGIEKLVSAMLRMMDPT